jgi:hypothetical protein
MGSGMDGTELIHLEAQVEHDRNTSSYLNNVSKESKSKQSKKKKEKKEEKSRK